MEASTPMKRHIKNVVYVMLENRSFDNLLGWLYDGTTGPSRFVPSGGPPFQGLTPQICDQFEMTLSAYDGRVHKRGKPVKGVERSHDPATTPFLDPGEVFRMVSQQLFQLPYGQLPTRNDVITCRGFYQNFLDAHRDYFEADALIGVDEILYTYTAQEALILNLFAGEFAVSDLFYSSIPSQTACNRAFSICGDSLAWWKAPGDSRSRLWALVDNQYESYLEARPVSFASKTIWNRLAEAGFASPADWKIYYSDIWPWWGDVFGSKTSYTYQLFSELRKLLNPQNDPEVKDERYVRIDQFWSDVKNRSLPRFSYIEPSYTGTVIAGYGPNAKGNDYHPPSDIQHGCRFLVQIYQALYHAGLLDQTLLIVTFDEHGGTFDHVAPPWNARNPRPAEGYEWGFDFTRFGVRVPAIFISPWIPRQTVVRSDRSTPLDHTSVIATLLDWFGLEDRYTWGMGDRVLYAPTFEQVITDTLRPTADLPSDAAVELPQPPPRPRDLPLPAALATRAARTLADQHGMRERVAEIAFDIRQHCRTLGDLEAYTARFDPTRLRDA